VCSIMAEMKVRDLGDVGRLVNGRQTVGSGDTWQSPGRSTPYLMEVPESSSKFGVVISVFVEVVSG
jgi:hypothetical protein